MIQEDTQSETLSAKDLMNVHPAYALPDTPLQEVARMMVEHDCGSIPIVEDAAGRQLIGMVTDRDITCRAVAQGRNPLELSAESVMSRDVLAVSPETSLEECRRTMAKGKVRRLPVCDELGCLVGILTQAHLARKSDDAAVAELLRGVSQPGGTPSRVASADL